jgi:hypothetical protein
MSTFWLELIWPIAIIGVAYTVLGLAGFGSALIAVPLLAWIWPLAGGGAGAMSNTSHDRCAAEMSASDRGLDGGNVDPAHLHHRVERPLGLVAAGGHGIGQHTRGDLPRHAPLVLAPAACAFLAAVSDAQARKAGPFLFLGNRHSLGWRTRAIVRQGTGGERPLMGRKRRSRPAITWWQPFFGQLEQISCGLSLEFGCRSRN